MSSPGNQSFHLLKSEIFRSCGTKWMLAIELQWTWESLPLYRKRHEAVLLCHKCRQGLRCGVPLWVVSGKLHVSSFCRGKQQTKREWKEAQLKKRAILQKHSLYGSRRNLASLSQAVLISRSLSALMRSLLLPLQIKDKSST